MSASTSLISNSAFERKRSEIAFRIAGAVLLHLSDGRFTVKLRRPT